MVFLGLFSVITEIADNYDAGTDFSNYSVHGQDESFNQTFNKIDETKSRVENITEEFEATVEDTGSIFPFISLGFKIGKMIFKSAVLIKDIAYTIPEIIGIPPIIIIVLISIVIIVLIITILMFILGRVYP